MSVIVKNCQGCKKDFNAPLSEHKRGKALFCSYNCFVLSKRLIDIIKKCLICNEEIHVTHVQRKTVKYCSRECYNMAQKPVANKKCLRCFVIIPHNNNYSRSQFCGISCSVRYRVENKK